MTDLKDWALQYVLADDDDGRSAAVAKTAAAIKNAPVKSTAVLNWVQSINPWMPTGLSQGEPQPAGDRDGESEVSVITRAKALDFLADTLAVLEKNMLRTDQVNLLIVFFGRLYSVDHKAGIMAATKALHQLVAMKGFKPEMADTILQSVASMRDDFRLQPPQTRLEIYRLITALVTDDQVTSQLQHKYGAAGGFALDLLQLSSHERDPNCLMSWFGILKSLLQNFTFSADVDNEMFKSFSAYFPISMRSSATPTGVTVDDLKTSVRACFASSERIAKLSLPFLLQKLDQGDAITIPVKVDILRTIEFCVESYRHPSQSVAPFSSQIWNSLKYEVRNGEVKEAIECTLDVIRAISLRLSTIPRAPTSDTGDHTDPLSSFVAVVISDCVDDLSNPTYTRPTGLLLQSILGAHARPFALLLPRVVETIIKNLREPRTLGHARSLLGIMKDLLDARSRLIEKFGSNQDHGFLEELYGLDDQIREHFYTIFARFWRENNIDSPDSDNIAILKETAQGFAALVCQPGRPDAPVDHRLLCDDQTCDQICATISYRVVNIFQLTSSPDTGLRRELADTVVASLRKVVRVYTKGYGSMLMRAISTIKDRKWGSTPSQNSLVLLKSLLLRLAYIGCSEIPTSRRPLQHLHSFSGSVMHLLVSFLDRKVCFEVSTITLAGIFSALLHFRDACGAGGLKKRVDLISVDWKECIMELSRTCPELLIKKTAQDSVASLSVDAGKVGSSPSDDVFRGYLECGIYVVSQLYQRAITTSETGSSTTPSLGADFAVDLNNHALETNSASSLKRHIDLQDVYLHQLADMATFVFRELEESEQQALQLQHEVFNIFSASIPPQGTWLSAHNDGRTNVLSSGILQGLRPAVMTPLYTSHSIVDNIMADLRAASSFPERTQKVRDGFSTVLANKWLPKASDQSRRDVWMTTVQSLQTTLKGLSSDPSSPSGLSMEQYSRLLALVAGAIARRDRYVEGLVNLLASIPSTAGQRGEYMARCMEDLLQVKSQLKNENHAVMRPLASQWIHIQVVRPKLEVAFPFVQNSSEALNNSIAIVHLLKHLDFSIYEDDVTRVVRLLIAGTSTFENRGDVEAALQGLRQVLAHKPDALKDQLRAIIAGAVAALGSGLDSLMAIGMSPGVPTRFLRHGDPARCRKQGLLLLQQLAQNFEERLLEQYKAQMSRVLATACGDPVREVRQCALAARSSWDKLKV